MCSEDWCVHCWLAEKLLIKTGLVTWTLLLVTAAGELMLASLSSVAIYLNRDPLFPSDTFEMRVQKRRKNRTRLSQVS